MESNPGTSPGAAEKKPSIVVKGIVLIAIAAAFAMVHGPYVKASFAKINDEDRLFFQHNATKIHSVWDCFKGGSTCPGFYRPLTTNLYFFIGRELFANRIQIYHLVNIAFFIANAYLLYLICVALLPGPWAALPPIFFVSRFGLADVATCACEFQALLSVFFTLLALRLFMTGRERRDPLLAASSAAAFGLALFCKETAAVFPALVLLFAWLLDEKPSWRQYIFPLGASAFLLIVYLFCLQALAGYQETGLHVNASFSNVLGNYSAYLLAFLNALTYKVRNPSMASNAAMNASLRWMWAAHVSLVGRAAFVILVGVSLVFAAIHRRLKGGYAAPARVFVFGILFFVIAMIPYVILNGRPFMRYGYLGDAGLAISSGVVLHEIAGMILRKVRKAPAPASASAS
jgi:hypothetical protein